jgi:TRAP-type C4-dicarboxylate transport system substrate-binding protein
MRPMALMRARRNSQLLLSACGAAMLLAACRQGTDATTGVTRIHVIGSATNSNTYKAVEEPFWLQTLPAAANGGLQIALRSIDESGLKAPQIARLLSAGALDVAYGDFASVAGDLRAFEGLDLAGVITDLDAMQRAADAYRGTIDGIFNQHGVKLLALFPYPGFAFYCSGEVASLAALRGRKVRVTTQSMSDFVREIGAVPVIIPFPDVVPALQTHVADCAVTGTYSGNRAGWAEVTDSLFTLPIGSGLSFYGYSARGWNELEPTIRELLQTEFARLENSVWDLVRQQTQTGINCNTGQGECATGRPAAMRLFTPTAADIARAHDIASQVVVPGWAKRCGPACTAEWNATVGKALGIVAKPAP